MTPKKPHKFGRYFIDRLAWFDKPDPPPAPDYTSAAIATGESGIENTRLQGRINRPDEYTPIGSRTWTETPGDKWTANINLSPTMQALLEQQGRVSQYTGNVGESTLGRVQGAFNTPFPIQDIPGVQMPNDARRSALSSAMLSRLEPKFARDEDALRTRLANQGIMQGSDAYNTELENFGQGRTDARIQADLAAGKDLATQYGMESGERGRAIQEAAYLRNLPLSELNALRTGAQPQMPQFQAYSGVGAPPATNFLGAAQAGYGSALDAYNAQAAQSGNLLSGLFGIGGAALGSPWLFS